ncbi:membrane lipoprotein lipid attachment site-containing protein [Virgibacillus doumboii]|uniref:membrane lipoprotein lipid attachment site-containing protein n=1 Tax=Virgibacillus doumboii TaxID=2697503 RepID=UPI0013E0E3C2|nr:membrane lipoprotein lipid attachment site-containing protein [Virgibacillus doumboii]
MKKILFLLSLVFMVLTGCDFGNDELTYENVNLEKTNGDVKTFINRMETKEDGTGNGIYMFNDTDKRYYLYLSQEFLDNGKHFGKIDIKTEESSLNIYLSDDSEGEKVINKYKVYEIKLDKQYKIIKVFKNGEETHFQTIGA